MTSQDKTGELTVKLVNFYNDLALELDARKQSFQETLQKAGANMPETHPDYQFSLGELRGREQTLAAVSAFIIANAADQADLLWPCKVTGDCANES